MTHGLHIEAGALLRTAAASRARFLREHGEADAALRALDGIEDARSYLIRAACALDCDDVTAAKRYAAHADAVGREQPSAAGSADSREAALVALRIDLAQRRRTAAECALARIALPQGDEDRVAALAVEAYTRMADFDIDAGNISAASRSITRAVDFARPEISDGVRARLLVVQARLALQETGRHRESWELAERAFALASAAHIPAVAAEAAMLLAEEACAQRDYATAIAATDHVLAATSDPADHSRRFAHLLRAQLFPLAGRAAEAHAELTEANRGLADGHVLQATVLLTRMTNYTRDGRFADAEALIARCRTLLAPLGEHPLLGIVLMFEALGAEARNRDARARSIVVDAVDLLEHRRNAGYLAAVYPAAVRLTRSRRFTDAHARLFSTARRTRSSVPAGAFDRPSTAKSLTARQRDVAALAAQGCTNKQIAERLVITPKTVTHHLEAVFKRLNVRSRWQLEHALRDTNDAPTNTFGRLRPNDG